MFWYTGQANVMPGEPRVGGFFLGGAACLQMVPKDTWYQVPIIENTQTQTSLKDFPDFCVLNEILLGIFVAQVPCWMLNVFVAT